MEISGLANHQRPESPAVQFGASVSRRQYEDNIRFGPRDFRTDVDVDVFEDVVLLSGARTPFGKIGGSLRDVSSLDLLKTAMKGALEKGNIQPHDVRQVLTGNIIANHEQSSFMARNVAKALDVPESATALSVNRLCGTGFEVLRQAGNQLTNGGERGVILTGGVENMSKTPVMDPNKMMVEGYLDGLAKKGGPKGKLMARLGRFQQDFLKKPKYENPLQKGLTDPMASIMIDTADELSKLEGVTREQADAFAARSQVRAALARANGQFDDEIVPVKKEDLTKSGPWRSRLSGRKPVASQDEHIRFQVPESAEAIKGAEAQFAKKMGKLPVINQNRTDALHTAASSSGVVDGAAAIAVSTGQFATEKNYPVLAKLKGVAISGCPAGLMGAGPIPAIRGVIKAAGLDVKDVDLFEVNEAFAGQAFTVARQVGIPLDKLNVDGGAIAIGHPLAASGSRITTHAAQRLKKDNARYAVVSACIGGGQGIAALIENPNATK